MENTTKTYCHVKAQSVISKPLGGFSHAWIGFHDYSGVRHLPYCSEFSLVLVVDTLGSQHDEHYCVKRYLSRDLSIHSVSGFTDGDSSGISDTVTACFCLFKFLSIQTGFLQPTKVHA